MASAKVVCARQHVMATAFKPAAPATSIRKAAFFGPQLAMHKAPSATAMRARQAVQVVARGAAKAAGQIQVRRARRESGRGARAARAHCHAPRNVPRCGAPSGGWTTPSPRRPAAPPRRRPAAACRPLDFPADALYARARRWTWRSLWDCSWPRARTGSRSSPPAATPPRRASRRATPSSTPPPSSATSCGPPTSWCARVTFSGRPGPCAALAVPPSTREPRGSALLCGGPCPPLCHPPPSVTGVHPLRHLRRALPRHLRGGQGREHQRGRQAPAQEARAAALRPQAQRHPEGQRHARVHRLRCAPAWPPATPALPKPPVFALVCALPRRAD